MDWIDESSEAWAREYPDVDMSTLSPITRLVRLGVLMDTFQKETLEPFELTPSDYAVLSTLRRAGPPYQLSPSELYTVLERSSGGMTKMLNRLEGLGLIERIPDPEDRRSIRVASHGIRGRAAGGDLQRISLPYPGAPPFGIPGQAPGNRQLAQDPTRGDRAPFLSLEAAEFSLCCLASTPRWCRPPCAGRSVYASSGDDAGW